MAGSRANVSGRFHSISSKPLKMSLKTDGEGKISTQITIPKCLMRFRALHDVYATGEGMFSFKKGGIINLVGRSGEENGTEK